MAGMANVHLVVPMNVVATTAAPVCVKTVPDLASVPATAAAKPLTSCVSTSVPLPGLPVPIQPVATMKYGVIVPVEVAAVKPAKSMAPGAGA